MSQFKNSDEYEKWKAGKLKRPHKRSAPKQSPPSEGKRSKVIAIWIVSAILVLGIAAGYYSFIYTPMQKTEDELSIIEQESRRERDRKRMERELDKKQSERIQRINEEERRKYEEREAAWLAEEQEKSEEQLQEEREKEDLYKEQMTACIEEAWDSYRERWKKSCETLGLEIDCPLDDETADLYTRDRQEYIDNCYKTYDRLIK